MQTFELLSRKQVLQSKASCYKSTCSHSYLFTNVCYIHLHKR